MVVLGTMAPVSVPFRSIDFFFKKTFDPVVSSVHTVCAFFLVLIGKSSPTKLDRSKSFLASRLTASWCHNLHGFFLPLQFP